eukprot:Blabericola_migrator_1__6063@NODE_3059_length_2071_cov_13_783433_g1912_i0_p2_GENE_NODE_3059_length_2071_cov_13_783433_g1912_i0NODE_3059_length_2071_cov_13_783433_g1912_i0_p2_ORF_typecomplete_len140_score21_86DUF5354/PF17305_2/0_00082_NODE_3059_length_2071_cov_13_783433_g1912_i08691288
MFTPSLTNVQKEAEGSRRKQKVFIFCLFFSDETSTRPCSVASVGADAKMLLKMSDITMSSRMSYRRWKTAKLSKDPRAMYVYMCVCGCIYEAYKETRKLLRKQASKPRCNSRTDGCHSHDTQTTNAHHRMASACKALSS